MTEEQVEELVVNHESLKLRVDALEDAILNIMGFYREEADGSTQGRIKFGTRKSQVAPVTLTPPVVTENASNR